MSKNSSPISLRDRLRAKTVGAKKKFPSEILEHDGEQYEIRQPSVANRAAIMKKARIQTGDVEQLDIAALQIWAIIKCTYVPETNERVFEDSDAQNFLDGPGGLFVDKFAAVAMRLMNVEAEGIEKNSEEITNDSSSTS